MLQLAWVEAILHTYRHIYMQIRTIRYVTALARTDLDPERWNQCWVSAVVIQSFLQPQQQMVTEADCSLLAALVMPAVLAGCWFRVTNDIA